MRKLIIPILCVVFLGCSQTLKTDKVAELSLKEALIDKFLIGTALNTDQIWEKDTIGVGVIERQFNSIVAENCMKSMHIQPKEGEFDFKDADKFVEFGEKRNMFIVGHALIWHTQAADWFFTDDKGKDVSKEVLIKRMKDHITTIVSRYKGRVNGWDVVNEAFEDDGSWRKTKFYQIIGEDYLPLAFKFAHEADPEAELYYNDYNEWYAGRRDAIVKMVTQLKKEGIRIDAVGMQAHIGMTYPSIDEYKAAIDAYASTGVKIAITEFELSALPLPRQNIGANVSDTTNYRKEMDPYTAGLPDSVAAEWTQRVSGFFDLFIDNSDKINRVTLWGVSDATSWKNDFPMPGRTDYPLLFDRNYKAKPVLGKIVEKAKETPKKKVI